MELTKGFKFKIIPDNNQETLIKKTFGCCRKIYNTLLGERNSFYEENKDDKEILKTFKYTTEKQLKEQFEFLKEVDSVALQQSRRHLNDAFDRFFKGLSEAPKFKSKKDNHNSYTTINQKSGKQFTIQIVDNKYLKIPKLGKVRVKLSKQLPKNYKINNVTISRNSRGIYFVSINFTYQTKDIQEKQLNIEKSIGLDYSSHDFYVDSEGNKANYPRFFRISEEKLAREQRKLSKMELHSNNYYKQKKKVNKIQEHIANQRKDFCHKLSCKLTDDFDYIFVEDINLQAMSRCLRLGKSTNDNGFGMFRDFLNYKALEKGKVFYKINKWDPTSQTCHICGCKSPITKDLGIREWICPECGAVLDRDINAAINIRNSGLLELGIVNSILELPFKD